jgi:hypothetical protein
MRKLLVCAAAAGLALGVAPSVGAAGGAVVNVRGGWIGELPCLFTALAPGGSKPTVVSFTCTSGTTWDGTWTGHTHYVVRATLDLVTGSGTGTIDETLVGIVTAGASPGTMHLLGTLNVDGATNTVEVDETIVGGTGAFAGSTGQVVFEGLQLSGVIGSGGYHGTWHRR